MMNKNLNYNFLNEEDNTKQNSLMSPQDKEYFDKLFPSIERTSSKLGTLSSLKHDILNIKGIGIEDLKLLKAYLKNREETIFQKDTLIGSFYKDVLKNKTHISSDIIPGASYYNTVDFSFGRDYRYIDYEMMDSFTPEISAALDAYAEYLVQKDPKNQRFFDLKIEENLKIIDNKLKIKISKEINLFFDFLEINKGYFLTAVARDIFKFGDAFILLEFNYTKDGEITGVKKIQYLNPWTVKIIYHPITKQVICYEYYPFKSLSATGTMTTNTNPTSPTEPQLVSTFNTDKNNQLNKKYVYTPIEIIHLKFSEGKFSPYGTSILENIRRTWKQLIMLEDMMTIYRINHSIDRRIVYVEVGDLPREEALEYLREVELLMNKKPNIDLESMAVDGRDWAIKAHSANEVLYIPTRGGVSNAGIQFGEIKGLDTSKFMEDLEYLQNKMFSKLKIPKAFLTYDKDINAKATLIEENKAFARTILNYQNIFSEFFWQIYQIDKWIKNELHETIGLKIGFGIYDYLIEKDFIESFKFRIEIAKNAIDLTWKIKSGDQEKEVPLITPEFILKRILNLSQEEIVEILDNLDKEKQINLKVSQKEEENTGEENEMGGGFESGGGGEIGGGFESGGGFEMGGGFETGGEGETETGETETGPGELDLFGGGETESTPESLNIKKRKFLKKSKFPKIKK